MRFERYCELANKEGGATVQSLISRKKTLNQMECGWIFVILRILSWKLSIQKYKGRVVLRGDIVKDDSGSYAVFAEQGSSASQMTAAEVFYIFQGFQDAQDKQPMQYPLVLRSKWKVHQRYLRKKFRCISYDQLARHFLEKDDSVD